MFKSFSTSQIGLVLAAQNNVAWSRPDNVIDLIAPSPPIVTKKSAPGDVPLQNDGGVEARLDLKSRLHARLLDQLNHSVLDKVQSTELRREIADLVSLFLKE